MDTYVMLTRLDRGTVGEPRGFEHVAREVLARLDRECPDVRWLANYAVLGPYDYVDVFEAPDNEAAARVAVLLRSLGHASVEIWPATSWQRFKEIARAADEGAGARPPTSKAA
jgi:uncharacterized protein with GYD domain